MCVQFDQRIADLEENMAKVIGRANALHSLLSVMVSSMPAEVAAQCAGHARDAAGRVDADILSRPIADPMRAEMKRVLDEGVAMLDAVAGKA